MKTRTRRPTKVTSVASQDDAGTQSQQLLQSDSRPSRLIILPDNLTSDARMVVLPRPSEQVQLSRYVLDPLRGVFEITTVGDEKSLQSWLLTPPQNAAAQSESTEEAYILQNSQFQVATAIDPVFLVLPMMHVADTSCAGMYRTWTDILYEDATDQWQALRQLLRQDKWSGMYKRFETAVACISDKLQLGEDDDATYRLSTTKISTMLLRKAIGTVEQGFPASLEERFIKQALELPTYDVVDSEELINAPPPNAVSVSSIDSKSTSNSQASPIAKSTAATSTASAKPSQLVATPDMKRLLRIRTTFDFMLRSYVPAALHSQIQESLSIVHDTIDFSPLVEFEEQVASRRREVQALRTLSDNISRKRKLDDDEAADKAAEKRKKKEEDDAKKKSMSHGVKKLMKADTSGMQKLSSFFTKKVAT